MDLGKKKRRLNTITGYFKTESNGDENEDFCMKKTKKDNNNKDEKFYLVGHTSNLCCHNKLILPIPNPKFLLFNECNLYYKLSLIHI